MAVAQRKMETFNSMKYFELLKESGVPEAQARIQVEMARDASRSGLEHLATNEALIRSQSELKEEINNLRVDTKEELNKLRIEVKEDIANLKISINTSKWQTLCGIAFLLVGGFLSKHLGF